MAVRLPNRRHHAISIRDNGVGIRQEMIEKMIGGSYKEENLKTDSNGIGMDNVIARLKLFTESEEVMSIISDGADKGTEFILYLSVKEREEDDV